MTPLKKPFSWGYQKTYSKNYLTHRTVKNDSVLPQWLWEGIVPAIIPIDEWLRVQDIFGAGRRGKKKADVIRKKFEFPRAKAGMLRGYYYLDPDWSREERDQFFTVMDAIINSADQQNEN